MKQVKRIICVLMLSVLMACKGADGKLLEKEDVLVCVQEQVPNEKYSLVSIESFDEVPKKDVYTFQSEERNLTFQAISTLSQIGIDASQTNFYHDNLYCDYWMCVQNLYKESIEEIIQSCPLYVEQKNWYNIDSQEDIELAASYLARANDLVKEELDYNTQDFLEKNPISYVHVVHFTKDDLSDWENIINININGLENEESIIEKIQENWSER